jgi:hypothetical protein
MDYYYFVFTREFEKSKYRCIFLISESSLFNFYLSPTPPPPHFIYLCFQFSNPPKKRILEENICNSNFERDKKQN